jgi:Domain of unknown function (DUF4351)
MLDLDIQFEENSVCSNSRSEITFNLVAKQLERRCGRLKIKLVNRVSILRLYQLEELAYALLDFKRVEDLENWLKSQAS